jgi:hypothetical protein
MLTNIKDLNGQSGGSDVDRPPHSYIALISMAILSKMDRKILLNEIYDWVILNFPYYQHRTDKSWRNSIRHNLSLNECFIKVGKAGNGRGYYWSIHAANMNDFKKGDFRRRQARLRAKHDKSSGSSAGSANAKKQQSESADKAASSKTTGLLAGHQYGAGSVASHSIMQSNGPQSCYQPGSTSTGKRSHFLK